MSVYLSEVEMPDLSDMLRNFFERIKPDSNNPKVKVSTKDGELNYIEVRDSGKLGVFAPASRIEGKHLDSIVDELEALEIIEG